MTLNVSAIIFMAVSPKLIVETIGRIALGALKTQNARSGSNQDNNGSLCRCSGKEKPRSTRVGSVPSGVPVRHRVRLVLAA